MVLKCKKCNGGRIVVDRMFDKDTQIEVNCLMCGKRWFLDAKTNVFAKYLLGVENKYRHYVVTL